ncbi:MAG: glycoside hydrolase family 88 protein [Opitutales bacterium]|nr:glycoside hydrolase family 88 protein [Opitutales bacterium]
MKRIQRFTTLAALALSSAAAAFADSAKDDPVLWYTAPAEYWTEALPVGNGSLGGMVFGNPAREQVQFNHDTLWTGTVHAYHRDGAHRVLPKLRELLREGRQSDAHDLAMREFMSVPLRQMMYQPFGDLYFDFPGHEAAEDYRRELNLASAVAKTAYTVDGVRFTRETFSSYPADVLVTRVTADRPGRVGFTLAIDCPHETHEITAVGDDQLLLRGKVQDDGIGFAARVRVRVTGGTATTDGRSIVVEGADAATVLLSAGTTFRNFRDLSGDPEAETEVILKAASRRDYGTLRSTHVADHSRLFNRVSLELGTSEAAELPTHDRLRREDKSDDPALAALLFHYGRYLLIASSRPGSQPANLQGIWNDLLEPSWGSKYTMNINFEMNYWPTEVTNLTESYEPVLDMIDELVVSGRETARAHYDADGWVLHHNTDIWRGTAPINHANHGIWPGGGAWLSFVLWERYRYTRDRSFLRDRAYPVMKEAARFYTEVLVEDPDTGWLISGPSNSPEHGGMVMGPTMDHQLIRRLFRAVSDAVSVLEIEEDKPFAARLDELRGRIAPNQIGRLGQLQEWLEDRDDPENDHRHVSHLWGVFPGDEITWENPDYMEAARTSLDFRGDGGTGWSLAWKIALWARLLDAERAHSLVLSQLNLVEDTPEGRTMSGPGGSYPNLFGAHPPFQIDGNFGTTGGIAEMLLQSHTDEIVLLPALPSAWSTGSVTGLRARGGFEIDMRWNDGELTEAVVRSTTDEWGRLRYRDRVMDVQVEPGKKARFGKGLRDKQAYDGSLEPLELGLNLMRTQILRFREWMPEGQLVPSRWGYMQGLLAASLVDLSDATGDPYAFVYGQEFFSPLISDEGSHERFEISRFDIDHVKPGRVILQLYERNGLERYRKMVENIRGQLDVQPRTNSGGYWHKGVYPYQMWLDGLYMAMPFLARYAHQFDRPEDFDEVVRQITLMDEVSFDPDAGLHYHAWDETRELDWSDPETGLSPNFWSRSIGWYVMALVDVLDYLPKDHPGYKQVIEILGRTADGIVRWQDERTGLWWQVTDQGERWGNYLESTAAAMFVYALTKAVNGGHLPCDAYADTIERGWQGILDHLLDVDDAGQVHLMQGCRVAGLNFGRDGSYEYYLSERIVSNDLKGVGPMIWACIEVDRYLKNQ